ncbi:hypothetical protein TPHA_0I00820 [Tetrapisispora phaffii CBS 4417]|uniref:Protein kinase domain-containing protein n=1 Tax=Tetrapisispora phaffii (strain ATCC 24235 / CBS 4417 / NBRC 1672 / NRRL Y-8282 / UCD 70-5) TaxID=1071381 RepID=G8BXG0_TETPH|nr:hypothetical protein TPHA_0I00820 [Tetrapisispora phaffii CBS 4417]CCE64588.1 hypothetical protein TPHA_0I00820 [Tetrapisispora phaffii CBS 4417]
MGIDSSTSTANSYSHDFLPPDIDDPPEDIPLVSIEDKYQLIEEIGSGSFGTVSFAKAKYNLLEVQSVNCKKNTLLNPIGLEYDNFNNKLKGYVAIKTMINKLSTLNEYSKIREIKFILAIPSSKYLLQIFEIFIDNKNFNLHIVMEIMEQNLYQMMKNRKKRIFSIPSLKSILSQILAGIKFIHENNFFHRDLKPENILISQTNKFYNKFYIQNENIKDNYVVKLADFGLSRHINNRSPYTAYVSTRWYRSPEILLRSGFYSKPLDIWAFGCVAIEVTLFKPIFPGANEMDQIWKILKLLGTPHKTKESFRTGYQPHGGFWEVSKDLANNLNLQFPYVEGYSIASIIGSSQLNDLTQVIEKCLRWNPNLRPTADELCKLDFFRNTVVNEEYIKNKNLKKQMFGNKLPHDNSGDVDQHIQNDSKIKKLKTNLEQAMIFAGMKVNDSPLKPLVFNEEENNNHMDIPKRNQKLSKAFSQKELFSNSNHNKIKAFNSKAFKNEIKPLHSLLEDLVMSNRDTENTGTSNKLKRFPSKSKSQINSLKNSNYDVDISNLLNEYIDNNDEDIIDNVNKVLALHQFPDHFNFNDNDIDFQNNLDLYNGSNEKDSNYLSNKIEYLSEINKDDNIDEFYDCCNDNFLQGRLEKSNTCATIDANELDDDDEIFIEESFFNDGKYKTNHNEVDDVYLLSQTHPNIAEHNNLNNFDTDMNNYSHFKYNSIDDINKNSTPVVIPVNCLINNMSIDDDRSKTDYDNSFNNNIPRSFTFTNLTRETKQDRQSHDNNHFAYNEFFQNTDPNTTTCGFQHHNNINLSF